jgi:hypothetical protein
MLKKMMIMAFVGLVAGGVATDAQALGLGGGGIRAGGITASPGLAFHPRAPGVSHGTSYCNLNPGYLEHPCF